MQLNVENKGYFKSIKYGNFIDLYRFSVPFRVKRDYVRKYKIREKKEERREDNIENTRWLIQRIVSCNSVGRSLFITLTFAENITDLRQANKEWRNFIKRFNYAFDIKLKYLCIVEFQKRGAIHYHAIFFNMPFIDNLKDVLYKIWGYGYTDYKVLSLTKQYDLESIKHIGSYVSKYFKKGLLDKRLVGNRAFFCSRGLVRPEIETPYNLQDIKKYDNLKLLAHFSYKSKYLGNVQLKRLKII